MAQTDTSSTTTDNNNNNTNTLATSDGAAETLVGIVIDNKNKTLQDVSQLFSLFTIDRFVTILLEPSQMPTHSLIDMSLRDNSHHFDITPKTRVLGYIGLPTTNGVLNNSDIDFLNDCLSHLQLIVKQYASRPLYGVLVCTNSPSPSITHTRRIEKLLASKMQGGYWCVSDAPPRTKEAFRQILSLIYPQNKLVPRQQMPAPPPPLTHQQSQQSQQQQTQTQSQQQLIAQTLGQAASKQPSYTVTKLSTSMPYDVDIPQQQTPTQPPPPASAYKSRQAGQQTRAVDATGSGGQQGAYLNYQFYNNKESVDRILQSNSDDDNVMLMLDPANRRGPPDAVTVDSYGTNSNSNPNNIVYSLDLGKVPKYQETVADVYTTGTTVFNSFPSAAMEYNTPPLYTQELEGLTTTTTTTTTATTSSSTAASGNSMSLSSPERDQQQQVRSSMFKNVPFLKRSETYAPLDQLQMSSIEDIDNALEYIKRSSNKRQAISAAAVDYPSSLIEQQDESNRRALLPSLSTLDTLSKRLLHDNYIDRQMMDAGPLMGMPMPRIELEYQQHEQHRPSVGVGGYHDVMVVEDNEMNAGFLLKLLEKFGVYSARCLWVTDGLQAVHRYKTSPGPFKLILMDLFMPQMDGYQATNIIRQLEGTDKHTPIVTVTANVTKGAREKCLMSGFDEYIAKPIRAEELNWSSCSLNSSMRYPSHGTWT
ncbi:hypothetical protein SAMD00019534_056400 [Acytostelium subglobosum LB1]|uniref:hypothetical protein n=1 Tax=Acytostelium subglobosum LB1 TaxID=1410327 RepID=UPI000644D995|nr:hypothetical protein SAMD00019534_056400 [Acytostelium subglobosum LB1]GAM22465.1 hypothetical protein SAMD00019534_056400 [Acytostelium subglobosum LB1]|eukprot:XP_012754585.1 hypothetical protein SAMD00019534_056400 [Acytostelium subglobosum LB1]